jgi:hypothetical protein
MNEELIEKAAVFALRHKLMLGRRLGFGLHGIVFEARSEGEFAEHALKLHRFEEPYARERDVYARLMEAKVREISGLRVPQLLRWDDDELTLEMTVVKPPFLLDFASGYLDFAPTFPDEVWEDWELRNAEQFGDDWTRAKSVLADLREYGIHMLDPSPNNICFR